MGGGASQSQTGFSHISKEKGKTSHQKREKGKRAPIDVCPDPTRHTHRARARTTRNDFLVELSPQPPMFGHQGWTAALLQGPPIGQKVKYAKKKTLFQPMENEFKNSCVSLLWSRSHVSLLIKTLQMFWS